jgi:hypothetical protein
VSEHYPTALCLSTKLRIARLRLIALETTFVALASANYSTMVGQLSANVTVSYLEPAWRDKVVVHDLGLQPPMALLDSVFASTFQTPSGGAEDISLGVNGNAASG